MLLAGTALGVSLLVQPGLARAAEECGAPAAGVVVCPAGPLTDGVSYTGVTDLTLTIPDTAPVSNTGAPAVLVEGSTGAVVVDAADVTGAGSGGLGILVTTTTGTIAIDADKAVTTGTAYAPNPNDAIVALSTSGDISVNAGEVSTAGPYTSGIAVVTETGDVVITVDKATSTGVGGGIISGQSVLLNGDQAVDGGSVSITAGEVTASQAAGPVQGVAYGDVTIAAGSITSNGGPAQGGAGFTSFGLGLFGRSYAGNVEASVDTLASSGQGNLGVRLLANDGDASLESGTVSVTGDNAYGIRVTATGAASVTAGTTSTSGNAGADGAGTYFADAILVEGGQSMTVIADQTSASGNGAGAIVAIGDGSISIQSNSAVATGDSTSLNGQPRFANAISAQSFAGDINIVSGLASTEGTQSWAIYASASNGAINIESETATTSGPGARAIYANGAGGVTIVSGTASTTGGPSGSNPSDAIFALTFGQPSDISITSETATTAGNGARGIFAWTNEGDIAIDSGTIATGGNQATGIMVDANGNIPFGSYRPASGGSGQLTIVSGDITTTGNNSWGIGVDHAGPMSITSGSITTSGVTGFGITVYGSDVISIDSGSVHSSGAAIIAWGDAGPVTIDSDDVVVGPNGDIGIFARTSTGDIVINAGRTETQLVGLLDGSYTGDAVGAFSQSGDITITSQEAIVVGEQAFGVYAISGAGAVTIDSGSISTAGAEGVGIYANAGQVTISSDVVTTTGERAIGIEARSAAGDIVIDSGAITTGGYLATGIMVDADGAIAGGAFRPASGGTGAVTITSGTIVTAGNDAWGIGVDHIGPIDITSESITTSGLYAAGITVYGGDTITIDSGSVETQAGAGIIAWGDTGDVAIDSDNVVVGPGGDIGVFARTSSGDIVINAGRTETQLVGILGGQYTGDAVGAFSQSGDITITSQEAVVVGEQAYGIYGISGTGAVSITSGSVQTSGVQGVGLYANGATVEIVSGTVSTTGDLAHGIQADGDDAVTIASESVVVSGANAIGIRANSGAGDIAVTSGDVSALGAGGVGVSLSSAGQATLVVDGDVVGADIGASVAGDAVSVTVEADGSVTSMTGVGLVLAASGPDGATVTTAGYIGGGDGAAAVSFDASDDTLVVQTGATFGGAVLAGDGVDTLVLSGAGQTGAQAFGDMLGFEQTSVEAGAWALTGLLQTDQIDIAAGAELTIDGTDGALGEIETSGGDLVIANDGRLVYASDDVDLYAPEYDVDISGTGEVELVSGAIVATGDWTFTGPTRVSGGELYVQNDIAGGLVQTGGVVVVGATLGVDDALLGTLRVTGTGSTGSFGGDIVVEGGELYFAWDGDRAMQNDIFGSEGEIIWAGGGNLVLEGVYNRGGLITNDSVGAVFFSHLGEASALNLQGGLFVLDTGDHVTGGLSGDADLLLGNGGVAGNLTVDMTGDLTYSGDLSGGGSLTKAGDGILRLSGDNSYTGLTSVLDGAIVLTGSLSGDVFVGAEGTFRLGRGGTEGDLTGDLEIAGLAIFDRSDEYEYTGDISGDGQLLKLGDERLVLSGEYNFTGVTIVRGGSVRILQLPDTAVVSVDNGVLDLSGATQTISGLSGGENGEIDIEGGALTVDQSGSTTFAGSITGSGSFTLTGGGVLELTGNNTYTGDTNVEDGLLQINGSVASNVNIGPSGVLGGAGDIGGDVSVGSGGIVGPGNSPGTLTVAGDFTFATGSTYQVEVLGDGQHDLLVVGGLTTIEGGVQVEVLAGGSLGDYGHLSQYEILTSAGGIAGQFAGVTSDMAFLSPYLVYSTNAVRLDLVRNDIRFNRFATTANQVEVADAAEATGYGADIFDAIVVQNAGGAALAYDALDGQIHADVFTSLVGGTGWLRSALTARQRTDTDAAGGWGAVLSGRQTLDGEGGAAGAETETSGLVAGGDILAGDLRLGAALSYSRDDLSVSDRESAAEITNVRLAAYAGRAFGPVQVTLGGVYGWSTVETTRDVVFPGFAERVTSEYDARTAELSAEISTRIRMNAATVEPFARATYLNVDTDGVEETGGSAALAVAGQSRDLSTLELGVRLSGELTLSGDAILQPRAGLAWRGASGDLNGVTDAAFQGPANGFAVRGAGLDESALAVSFGADLVSTGRFRFSLDVEGIYGDQSESRSVRAGGSWRF
jgi:outer membrane autotransporter protein